MFLRSVPLIFHSRIGLQREISHWVETFIMFGSLTAHLLVDLFLGKWKLIYDILHCTIIGACNNNIIFRNDLWKYANICVVKIYCLFCSLDRLVP